MTTSRTIAALLGPVFLISGLMLLTNLGAFPRVVSEMSAAPTLLLLAGYMSFVPGLAIVIFHNHWHRGWPLVVTVCGWLLLVVGTIRILFAYRLAALLPDLAPRVLPALPVVAVVMLAIGAFLSFQGFRRG